MSVLKVIYDYASKMFYTFIAPDSSLASDSYNDIMSNKEDRKNYQDAIKEARSQKKEQEVVLSTGETLIVAP